MHMNQYIYFYRERILFSTFMCSLPYSQRVDWFTIPESATMTWSKFKVIYYTAPKFKMFLEIEPLKKEIPFQNIIFWFHVNLWGWILLTTLCYLLEILKWKKESLGCYRMRFTVFFSEPAEIRCGFSSGFATKTLATRCRFGVKGVLVSGSALFLHVLPFFLKVFDAWLCLSHTSVFLLQTVACSFLFLVFSGRKRRQICFLHTNIEVGDIFYQSTVKGAVIKSTPCSALHVHYLMGVKHAPIMGI